MKAHIDYRVLKGKGVKTRINSLGLHMATVSLLYCQGPFSPPHINFVLYSVKSNELYEIPYTMFFKANTSSNNNQISTWL